MGVVRLNRQGGAAKAEMAAATTVAVVTCDRLVLRKHCLCVP